MSITFRDLPGHPVIKTPCLKCQCDCGNIIETTGKLLRKGQVQSCGCLQKEKAANFLRQFSSSHYINEIGNKYGKLTVIAKADKQDDSNGTWWKCQCDCGNIKITKGQYLDYKMSPIDAGKDIFLQLYKERIIL